MRLVSEIVREAEDNYLNGQIELGEYVSFDMHDVIETIDAYLNSRHKSGSTDSLGREKPFFNIVTAACNIWYRATDLDRKNIRILPGARSQTAAALIANILLQNWMRTSRFGIFLNEWGRSLARYGSSVVKFVEKDGELSASVIPWNRLIVDPVDFDSIPTIEKLYYTPEQLRANPLYDQGTVKALIESSTKTRETLDKKKKDNLALYIEVYEVHGMMPKSFLTDDPDEEDDDFVQQMHVFSYTKATDGKSFNDFTLYKGREKKHPYMLTHLIKEDGRTLSIGAVEYLFDSQWMMNHSIKNMLDTLDISSKLIFQTADSNFVGRNVLSAIQAGDIFVHKENMPITRLANDKPDIAAFQNFGVMWQSNAQELTSTPDSLRGTTLPSGTPYSLGAFLGGQANSLFELMTENKGLYLEEMMREYVIPHLKTKMNTNEEIVAILDDAGVSEFDSFYVPRKAVKIFNERSLDMVEKALQDDNAPLPSPFNPEVEEGSVRDSLKELGNTRYISPGDVTWAEALKDLEMNVMVEVTNEETDKQAVLTTLSAVLQTVASNPAILQDDTMRMILGQILTETGRISPIQLSSTRTSNPSTTTGGAEALVKELPKANAPTR